MSETIRPDISLYQQTILVAKEVYELTCKLPIQQQFVLTSQLRRSIINVCNRLSAFTDSNSKSTLKRNSEFFIKVYAEIKTQMKISITLGHFTLADLSTLENSLDQILVFCESNIQSSYRN
ncbi:MAG: four helix bundle protein [Sediminibacterium sp.]|jgi:four helix bundle protein